MARKVIEIHAAEAEVFAGLLRESDLATKAMTEITKLICGREGISDAIFRGLNGTKFSLDVPDDPISRTGDPAPVVPLKLDRTESPKTDSGAGEGVQTPETPSESKPGPALAVVGAPARAKNDDLPGDTGHGT